MRNLDFVTKLQTSQMQTFVTIKALLRKIRPLLPEINREGKQTFGVLNESNLV